MKRTVAVILFLIFSNGLAAFGQNHRQIALQDGLMLDGIDGKISSENGLWYFSVFESLTDGKGSLNTDTPVQILPSGMLEKLAGVVSDENKNFRIWGKFTRYHNKNFIYLSYFIPVTEANQPPSATEEPDYADPNEEKIIPDDVLAMLRPKRTINLAELKKPLSTGSDGIIADRTGFLKKTQDGFYFNFDAIGRNIDSFSLPLLNCEVLENIIKQQNSSAEPLRYKISAIVTGYKGKNYMLLQRATRAYSHGNFAR
ncbi:MAG: hypothetical protein WCE45_04960 [Sedimentisphaerales bacterium]